MPSSLLNYLNTRRLWRLFIIFLVTISILYWLPLRPPSISTPFTQDNHAAISQMCKLHPDDGNIAVFLKTGAQENLKNLSNTLRTCLSCVNDVTVLSDIEQSWGDIHIHDVLTRFSRENMKGNPEFDIYFKQLQMQAEGREDEIPSLASILAIERDWRTKGSSAGWALDKYKWLHMFEAAWDLRPNREWYVFVETDTYISWPNLKRWLPTLDSKQFFYGGFALQKSDERKPLYFAHGGSGVVMSGALMREFAVNRRGIARKYEHRMHEWHAGDFTLADVLYDEMGVQVTQMMPMLNSQPARSLPFHSHAWCRATMGMHHMKANDFDEIFELEAAQGFSRLLLRDLYFKVYPQGLPSHTRSDWFNFADAKEFSVPVDKDKMPAGIDPNSDSAACRTACETQQECFSFMFLNTTVASDEVEGGYRYLNDCRLSKAFRIGEPKAKQDFGSNSGEPDTYRQWGSGWLHDRISQFATTHRECPASEEFLTDTIFP